MSRFRRTQAGCLLCSESQLHRKISTQGELIQLANLECTGLTTKESARSPVMLWLWMYCRKHVILSISQYTDQRKFEHQADCCPPLPYREMYSSSRSRMFLGSIKLREQSIS